MKYIEYVKRTRKEARRSDFYRYGRRTACIIVKKGRIISIGINKMKNRIAVHKSTIHAEVDSLNKSNGKLNGATAYIFRVYGGLSEPCALCWNALMVSGIRKIYWEGNGGMIKKWIK